MSDLPHLSDDAWLEHALELTLVHESYMFRHPQQIEAVVRFLKQRPGSRMWSAACGRGEEPLSLALALGAEGDHVTIFASDVSRAALLSAQQGLYRRWSLRDLDASLIAQAFVPQDDLFLIDSRWADRVQYSRINLACPDTPWPERLDVVLLRNVLLYFSEAAATLVLERVLGVLEPDGLLVVSPAEVGLLRRLGWHVAAGLPSGFMQPSPSRAAPTVSVLLPSPPARPLAPLAAVTRPVPIIDPHDATLSLARRLIRSKEPAS